ncbi:MAG: hypothetical protein NTZ33_02370 [Bacteroidetes bacterium]|nr:hypothetical protein [Bacteroidota bacterium]
MDKKKEVKKSKRRKDYVLHKDPTLHKMIKNTKTFIRITGVILTFNFVWLEFHELPLIPLFTNTFSSVFFKIILALFFASWIAGTSKDLEDEESALLVAPNKGKLTMLAIGTIVILGVLFAWLCKANTYSEFAIALSVFYIFNIISWYYLKLFVKESINESIKKYEEVNDIYGLKKIKTIEDFLLGKWQVKRFAYGFIFLVILNILAFTNYSQNISTLIDIPSTQFIIVLSFFMYLGEMEIWIWLKRIKRDITFELIEEFKVEMKNN